MIETMGIEGIVKVNELEEVAQGRKCAFSNMIPDSGELSHAECAETPESRLSRLTWGNWPFVPVSTPDLPVEPTVSL